MMKILQCVIRKGTVHWINCNILTVQMRMEVSWDVMLCRWVCNSCFSDHSAFKTLGTAYPMTLFHIPEHLNPQQYHCRNLKSSIVKMLHYQEEPPKESLYRGNSLCKYIEFLGRHTQCWQWWWGDNLRLKDICCTVLLLKYIQIFSMLLSKYEFKIIP